LIRFNQQSAIENQQLLIGSEPFVDFGDSKLDLLLAHGMLGRFSLLFEIGFRQAERLEFADFLGIDLGRSAGAASPFSFPFFNLFLNPRFCVDEAFSGITHKLVLAS
jgi:hypothetical protein